MSLTAPPPVAPPPPPRRRGFGCLGCGCVVLFVLIVLVAALVAGASYFGYQKALGLTSTAPAEIPKPNPSEDLYRTTEQKLSDFGHDLRNHQPTKISLSADELNSMLARSPAVIAEKAHVYVSLNGGRMRMQASIPTDSIAYGLVKNRFVNVDASFVPEFSAADKTVTLHLYALQIGEQVTPDNLLPAMETEFSPAINLQLRKDPSASLLLDQCKSMQVIDGELVLETQ